MSYPASAKQIAFIDTLAARSPHTFEQITAQLGITPGAPMDSRTASALLDALIPASRPASAKQIAYVESLITDAADAAATILADAHVSDVASITGAQASALIDALLPIANERRSNRRLMQEAKAAAEGLTPGMYERDGIVVKVYPSTNRPGVLLAKRLTDDGWVYAGAASKVVTASMAMTKERAIELGHATGVCVCCGRQLSHPDSVAAGIGPVCASRF